MTADMCHDGGFVSWRDDRSLRVRQATKVRINTIKERGLGTVRPIDHVKHDKNMGDLDMMERLSLRELE